MRAAKRPVVGEPVVVARRQFDEPEDAGVICFRGQTDVAITIREMHDGSGQRAAGLAIDDAAANLAAVRGRRCAGLQQQREQEGQDPGSHRLSGSLASVRSIVRVSPCVSVIGVAIRARSPTREGSRTSVAKSSSGTAATR